MNELAGNPIRIPRRGRGPARRRLHDHRLPVRRPAARRNASRPGASGAAEPGLPDDLLQDHSASRDLATGAPRPPPASMMPGASSTSTSQRDGCTDFQPPLDWPAEQGLPPRRALRAVACIPYGGTRTYSPRSLAAPATSARCAPRGGLRRQPDPDRRPLPPGAPHRRRAGRLRRRAADEARPARHGDRRRGVRAAKLERRVPVDLVGNGPAAATSRSLLAILCLAASARAGTIELLSADDRHGDHRRADRGRDDRRRNSQLQLRRDPGRCRLPGSGLPLFASTAPRPLPRESPDQLELGSGRCPHSFSVYAEDPETAGPRPCEPATRSFDARARSWPKRPNAEAEDELEEEAGRSRRLRSRRSASADIPPAECLLRTARARVFTSPGDRQGSARRSATRPSRPRRSTSSSGSVAAARGFIGQARDRFPRSRPVPAHRRRAPGAREMARVAARPAASPSTSTFARGGAELLPPLPDPAPDDQPRRTVHGHAVWLQSDSGLRPRALDEGPARPSRAGGREMAGVDLVGDIGLRDTRPRGRPASSKQAGATGEVDVHDRIGAAVCDERLRLGAIAELGPPALDARDRSR